MRYLLFVTATVTLLIKWSVAGAQFSDSNSNVLLTPEQITSVVIDGTVNDLQKIIKNGNNINKPLPNSTILNTAIHSIIVNKENLPEMAVEKVKVLIEAGVDVNYSPYGMSPLIMAVTIPAQIRQAENKMIEDINKQPSLYISQLGREETKESLYNVIKETKVFFADYQKTIEPHIIHIIRLLLDNGANVNQAGADNAVPLHFAANTPEGESLEILKLLINSGVNVNVKDGYGNTPLFVANFAGNDEAIKLLIQAGADINVRNNAGQLYYEYRRGEIVDSLLR